MLAVAGLLVAISALWMTLFYEAQPGTGDLLYVLRLDNLPPQVTLAMTTRADPPLALARLRARGELVEVRAADLRFTTGEAEVFLNEVMAQIPTRAASVAWAAASGPSSRRSHRKVTASWTAAPSMTW